MKINWYRFGQKKGSYLSRNISYLGMFKKCYLKSIPHFGFNINQYKYVNWKHYFNKIEIQTIYGKLLPRILKQKKLKNLLNYAKKYDKKIIKVIHNTNLTLNKHPSNQKIVELFKNWLEIKALIDTNVPCINFIVRVLSQAVEKEAKKYFPGSDEQKLKHHLLILSYSSKETVFYRREKQILTLAIKLKKYYSIPYSRLPKNIKRLLNVFHKKYIWMDIMFLIHNPTTPKDIWNEINALPKKNPRLKLLELKQIHNQALKTKKQLLNKIYPQKKFLSLLKLLEESTWTETEIIKYFQLSSYYSLPFLTEIADKISLDYTTLINLSPEEIETALRNKTLPPKKKLEQRQKMFGFYWDRDKKIYQFFQDKKILKKFAENEITKKQRIIYGMTASPGLAKGRVKIILDTSELPNFKKGEILVTTMTTPNFLIAMKKSAGIVTNDGGITCHAAIVSRELGIPCIIGTKIATEVLKDGDMVEVNANHGWIRKLK